VRKFSDYCDNENIFYQPPDILNLFAKQTNYKVPIIGINVLHTQLRFNSPDISVISRTLKVVLPH